MSLLTKVKAIKVQDAKQVLSTAKIVVQSAQALNTTGTYKHKEKVDKALYGASVALSVLERLLR